MGKPTGQLDALIASVARSGQDILVSGNTPYFINIANFKLDNCLRTNSQDNQITVHLSSQNSDAKNGRPQTASFNIQFFQNHLHYTYLENWKDRENNCSLEPEHLRTFLKEQGYSDTLIKEAINQFNELEPFFDSPLIKKEDRR